MSLQDYWKPTTDKEQILRGLPPVPEAKIGRRRGCRCKHADAHECAVERKLTKLLDCDCECHSH